MSSKPTAQLCVVHLDRLEKCRPAQAKADLKNLEAERVLVGRIVERTFQLAGLTDKEGAARLNLDTGQLGRWKNGSERAQLDRFLKAGLSRYFLLAHAEVVRNDGIELEQVLHVRAVNQ